MSTAHPIHERGLRLGYDHWTAVVLMPAVCRALGEELPSWALDLCRHTAEVYKVVPPALLDALLGAGGDQAEALCDDDAMALGVDLDLCVMSSRVDHGTRILITPFGHAVGLLHRMCQTAIERGSEQATSPARPDASTCWEGPGGATDGPGFTTVESVSNVGESASLAVIQALARILEYAEVLLTHGYGPRVAIARALKAHQTGFVLACVARAAWAVVTRFYGASRTDLTAHDDGPT